MARKPSYTGQMPLFKPESSWQVPTELPDLRGAELLALDTETRDDGLSSGRGPGWATGAGRIVGVSVAVTGRSWYIPVAHPETQCFDREAVGRWLGDLISSAGACVFQNAPYDLGWLRREWGISPPRQVHDTVALAYMLDENRLTYRLDDLCRWQGVPGKDETGLREAAAAYGVDPKAELWRLPARYVGSYAERDAESCLELFHKFHPQVVEQGLTDAYQLEMDLIPMILEMRWRGVCIDMSAAEQVRGEMQSLVDQKLAEIARNLGSSRPVDMKDVRSPAWLERTFTQEGVPFSRTPKTGRGSFESKWMSKFDHWLPRLVSQATMLHDAGEKFIRQYIMDFTHMGRLHAEIHQFRGEERGGTRSYRLAYSNPPLQQMPARVPEISRAIRGLFLPESGDLWAALDYSQQEYRLIAHFAAVCRMTGADEAVARYEENPNTDFHQMVADMAQIPRKQAKNINFGIAYGEGKHKLAADLGVPLDEAVRLLESVDSNAPFVRRLSEFCSKRAEQRGYIKLLDGARSRFDDWEPRWRDRTAESESRLPCNPCSLDEARRRIADPQHPWSGKLKRAFTHKSMNRLIQGSAARQTKRAMLACWREGIIPLLQMHDELDFSVGDETMARRAQQIMVETVPLMVPVVVDAEFGRSWGEATHSEWLSALASVS